MSHEEDQDQPAVYRAPMRARDRDTPRFEGARCGVSRGLVGIGDALDFAPESLNAAIAAVGAAHGEKAGRMLLRFAGLPDGTFVWTQIGDYEFRLGRIAGPLKYDETGCIQTVGIPHVRRTRWLSEGISVVETPAGVTDTFARGGKNLQRINDPDVESATAGLWTRSAAKN